jgi:formyl-CoA transferase
MLPYTTAHWKALFEHTGRHDLADKYDLDDRHQRNARIRELYADMASMTGQMSTEECLALCARLDIPATRIYSIDELPEHPHLKAVGLFERVEHPTEGPIYSIRPPTLFGRTPAELASPAPTLGEHTDEVLREAGLDDAEIDALAAAGAVRRGRGSG